MEYGGYIELEKFQGNMLHSEGIPLNCGRSCLMLLNVIGYRALE